MHTYEMLLLHFKRIKVYVPGCKAIKKRITNYIKRLDLIFTSTRKFTRLRKHKITKNLTTNVLIYIIIFFFYTKPLSHDSHDLCLHE